jgi:phage tail sheath protein FI
MTTQFLHGTETIELNDGVRPVKTAASAPIFVIGTADDADEAVFPLNTAVLLAASPRKAQKLGTSGTLLGAIKQIYAEGGAAVIVVRVASSETRATQLANIIGSPTNNTGVYAALNAQTLTGVRPKTFIAPGFTSDRPVNTATPPVASPNPVVAALLEVATKLRGRVYADAPSTSDADALAYRNDWTSARVVVFYPAVEIWDNVAGAYVAAPASASNAGLTARVHNENGFWFSPSNFAFNGVGGVAVPIAYSDDPNDQADILNSSQIVVTMSAPNNGYPGWRRWGNATCSDDPEWVFESVRTCADMIYESVQAVQAWAVDKPPSVQLLREMAASMQGYFDYLAKLGAIVGGKVWLDPERNTPQQTSQGIWAWDFDPEPVAPMEHIQNYAHRNQDYYTALVTAVASALNGG